MDASDAAEVEEFVARFRETRDALRTELAFTSEPATIRRVLDYGEPLERGALLTILGHGANIVVKLTAPDDVERQAEGAADERAQCFLRGLIGDGERIGKETLRPRLDAIPSEGAFVLNIKSGEVKPFTAETAATLFS